MQISTSIFWVGPVVKEGFYYDIDLGHNVINHEAIQAIEKAMNEVKQNAIIHLDGAETGYTNKYNVSYKESARTSVDTKTLKEKYPQVYADCIKTTKTRTFKLSKRKDV